jgi:hypothetical protein
MKRSFEGNTLNGPAGNPEGPINPPNYFQSPHKLRGVSATGRSVTMRSLKSLNGVQINSGYYQLSIYQDQKCSNLVFTSYQQLNICYQQNIPTTPKGSAIYLKSMLFWSGTNYTNVDTYYYDSQCLRAMPNNTITYGPISPNCGAYRTGNIGYFAMGTVVQQVTSPSISNPIVVR